MAFLGLILICIGWGIQLISSTKKIEPLFVLVYALGAAMLTLENVVAASYSFAILNLLSVVIALAVYLKIRK